MCIFVFYLEHKLFQLQMQFQTVKINQNFDGLERIHRCFDYGTEMIFFSLNE